MLSFFNGVVSVSKDKCVMKNDWNSLDLGVSRNCSGECAWCAPHRLKSGETVHFGPKIQSVHRIFELLREITVYVSCELRRFWLRNRGLSSAWKFTVTPEDSLMRTSAGPLHASITRSATEV